MDATYETRSSALARATEAKIAEPLLAGSRAGLARLGTLLDKAATHALSARHHAGPLPSGTTREVLGAAELALGPAELPAVGVGDELALGRVARVLSQQGLDLSHPRAAAHLQPPPLSVAVAADALASASNASLDTYDSGPSAIAIERWLIQALIKFAGFGPGADGVLTPGGSISNLLGLLLARDFAAHRWGVDVRRDGLFALPRPIVLCSELAHFSVQRACAALGLGEAAVQLVSTDARRRLRPQSLVRALDELGPGSSPVAIVATAGTTDFGSVDPLPEMAAIARERGIWFHVDAAYGFGALFSERLAPRLSGLALADSITLDLHKLGWQPAAASVLLVSNTSTFSALEREVQYLNPSDDAAAGLDGLLGRSLQTTRRPDAVKIYATFISQGRNGLGALVDSCHELARHAEQSIVREPRLELVAPAELTTVVFRYRTRFGEVGACDRINAELRRRLLERGVALLGRTAVHVDGPGTPARVCLKLTLLNPSATCDDIDGLLELVVRAGRECERHFLEQTS